MAALSWRREGGIAGFCDDLTVSVTGEARASSCRSGELYPAGTLTAEELAQLQGWVQAFGSVAIEMKDPAAVDAMTVTLSLNGNGSGQPTDDEKQSMIAWAQALYERLKP